jgi:hypothetical protein
MELPAGELLVTFDYPARRKQVVDSLCDPQNLLLAGRFEGERDSAGQCSEPVMTSTIPGFGLSGITSVRFHQPPPSA